MKITRSFQIISACAMIASPVWADAARISAGGAVHQLHGSGTVSMETEIVKIDISDQLQKVDCTFNFKNNGPKCSVRIGFPDFTNIPDLTNEETASHLKPSLLSYQCYVDGKECKSELVPADSDYGGSDDIKLWHASDVEVPANSKITVRSSYSQLPDLSPVDVQEPIEQFIKVTRYILQTAASWKGPVKRADIFVTFDKNIAPQPMKLVSVEDLMRSGIKSSKIWWSKANAHTVCYSASAKPLIRGQQLHFTLTNFCPTEKDDLLLLYEPMNVHQAQDYAHYVEAVEANRKVPTVHVPTTWIFPKVKQKDE